MIGYNAMSMSRGNGIFSGRNTDWRFYDIAYTSVSLTPQQNASLQDGSVLSLADQLQGSLLLIHGTADDNVHVQNSIEYSRALIEANKHFDQFFFPDKDHFITGGNIRKYLYEKVIDYFKRNL